MLDPEWSPEKWREDHPNDVWTGGTQCGICYKTIQLQGTHSFEAIHDAYQTHQRDEHPEWAQWAKDNPIGERLRDWHKDCVHEELQCPCRHGCNETVIKGCSLFLWTPETICDHCEEGPTEPTQIHGIGPKYIYVTQEDILKAFPLLPNAARRFFNEKSRIGNRSDTSSD